MRRTTYIGLLGLAATLGLRSLPGLAQTTDDHLTPAAGVLTAPATASAARLRQQLGLDSVQMPLAMVVVQPSFEPAYGLWVKHLAGNQYSLTYRAVAKAAEQAKTKTARPLASTCLLDPTVAQALADLFAVALAQTRYDTFQGVRSDGTTFTFIAFQPGIGLRSGEAWSPTPNSNVGALVDIVATMRETATTPDQPGFRQGYLRTQTQSLLLRLASH